VCVAEQELSGDVEKAGLPEISEECRKQPEKGSVEVT